MRTESRFDRRCYWLLLVVTINVPGFTQFDTTGKTHDFGLFNIQSISHILLTVLVGGLALLFFITRRTHAVMPLVRRRMNLLVAMYSLFFITALPWGIKNLAISTYRLAEWALVLSLVVGLYGSSPERTDKLSSNLLYRLAATIVAIVTIFAVFAPHLALEGISADTGFIDYRFGGVVYPPNMVGTMSAIALYYVIMFRRGTTRLLLGAFFAATLILTYSRGALISFVLGYLLVTLFFGKPLAKVFNLLFIALGSAVAIIYQDKIMALLSRGKSTGSLTTASGRLAIWLAGWKMFLIHPFRGWGYVTGVKYHILSYYPDTTFAPEHLHNELLQAIVSGGIFAGILLIIVYFRALLSGIRQARLSTWQMFLFFAFIQILGHAVEGPILSDVFTAESVCALVCITSFAIVQRYGLPAEPKPTMFIPSPLEVQLQAQSDRQ